MKLKEVMNVAPLMIAIYNIMCRRGFSSNEAIQDGSKTAPSLSFELNFLQNTLEQTVLITTLDYASMGHLDPQMLVALSSIYCTARSVFYFGYKQATPGNKVAGRAVGFEMSMVPRCMQFLALLYYSLKDDVHPSLTEVYSSYIESLYTKVMD
eukprot:CAMPEP_0117428684 /NCGR_PEP_ID=MMETSP0758-20121206/8325_1 /TAXON_ID=63605 /ORGANISM="Percolomonas cosmopolitus, Strain AE-1 (ATCC 50343)" /LENGTH=152 /DNA_ID=CAMNT_0005215153 /DNA_START=270 /DNA_END=725 /DNA_ORIENTATION=+